MSGPTIHWIYVSGKLAMQYRPKKLNKLILHKDIGENLSKLVSQRAWYHKQTAIPHTVAVSLASKAKFTCRCF